MNPLFRTHKLSPSGFTKAIAIAKAFDTLLGTLEAYCTNGREFAILKTKLEEACFFAKKAMAIDPANRPGAGKP